MRTFYPWPDSPALSLFVLWLASQVLLYAARVPMHRALRKLGAAVGGGFRVAGRWMRSVSEELRQRNREVLLESGRVQAGEKLEHELRRLSTTFTSDLQQYPILHRRLDEAVKRAEEDFKASSVAPPEAPGWPQAIQAVAGMEKAGDRTVHKILEEIRRAALVQEKQALHAYREATAKRHGILAQSAVHWKAIRAQLGHVAKVVAGTLEAATRADGYMERYEKIAHGEEAAEHALAASSLNHFLISAFVVAVAGFGGFVNFQLIARPMSELVPGGAWVLGMPVSTIAALVIVLMEVAAGIFVMETLGITQLFPRLSGLSASRRRIILVVALTGLLVLAAVEASLAILREQLLEADKALALALAGTAIRGKETVAAPLLSHIPMIGQAVLGFILPWILAMIAVPLEMLVESGRHVVGRALALVVRGLGAILRVLAHLFRYLTAAAEQAYDIYVIIPLQLERLVRTKGEPEGPRPSPLRPGLRNPAERTAAFRTPH